MKVSSSRVLVPRCVCVCPSSVISSHIASHLRAGSPRPAWPHEVDGLGLVLEAALSVSHQEGQIVIFIFLIAHIEMLVELTDTA